MLRLQSKHKWEGSRIGVFWPNQEHLFCRTEIRDRRRRVSGAAGLVPGRTKCDRVHPAAAPEQRSVSAAQNQCSECDYQNNRSSATSPFQQPARSSNQAVWPYNQACATGTCGQARQTALCRQAGATGHAGSEPASAMPAAQRRVCDAQGAVWMGNGAAVARSAPCPALRVGGAVSRALGCECYAQIQRTRTASQILCFQLRLQLHCPRPAHLT